jgi:fumarylpyruvate hydrolase
LTPVKHCGHPSQGAIKLLVNDVLRQESDLNQLIWNVPDTIAYLSTLFVLEPGDLIFSGTPAGVAAVKKGDVLKGHVDGLPDLTVRII